MRRQHDSDDSDGRRDGDATVMECDDDDDGRRDDDRDGDGDGVGEGVGDGDGNNDGDGDGIGDSNGDGDGDGDGDGGGDGRRDGNTAATTVMDGATAMSMATAIEGAMTMRRRQGQWTVRGRRRSKARRQRDGVEGATAT